MRIGFVLDDSLDKTDGVQQYVLTLGRWLTQNGHEVHYLAGNTRRTDLPHLHSLSKNVQVHFNENRMSTPLPADKSRLKQLLKKENFHVLHIQMPYSPFLGGRIIKLAGPNTAVVGTFHIIPYSWPESLGLRLLKIMTRKSLARIDTVFSVSRPAAKFASKSTRRRSAILPNVIDTRLFNSGRRVAAYDDGKINIVFLGRLVERKGCLLLLQAIEHLHQAKLLARVRVLIGGKGPLRAELERFVHKKHLGSVVHFAGFISEERKPDFLASADIAVFPSTGGESFGIVLLEAMAAAEGAVLAGNNPGYKWVMKNNKEQLVDPRDARLFAKKLQHFILNSKARASAKRWQKNYVKNFDAGVIGPVLLKSYEQAIAKRRGT